VSETPAPEFSRPVPMSEIGAGAFELKIEASDAEMAALATRFALLSLEGLKATISLCSDGNAIKADGRFAAQVTQSCVASGEPVFAQIDEPIEIRFLADGDHSPDTEIELSADDCDTMFHDGRIVDLGEAVAQSLALALDPFPRSAKAKLVLKAAGVKAQEEVESEAGPFAALAALKDKMGKP
jgi:uncharacterized metal-binding protein YceD (DUF177 family)